MRRPLAFTLLAAVVAGAGSSLLPGCSQAATEHAGNLQRIKSTGVLTVVTRNAPTAYYVNRDTQPAGPEQAMTAAFAKHLGVKVKYRVEDSISAVLKTLAAGRADIAAAGLTATAARRKRFAFGPAYRKVHQQVVCNPKSSEPENVPDLAGADLVVIADSSYVERLQALRAKHPKLHWRTDAKVGTEKLMWRVWKGKAGCTVADSNIVAINRRYYPSLKIMFDLSPAQPLAWALPEGATGLRSAVKKWFRHYRARGKLAAMNARYYDYIPEFDYVDKQALHERLDKRYPKYEHSFDAAADKHDIPPALLAAQAYQESKWNPKAKSPTGVRGIMMLTRRTAKALGVKNRLNPVESIRGGAKYLARMQAKLGDGSSERDATLVALAAYNIGYAHILDAQRLAKRLGRDPDSWAALRKTLPLLADKRYYPSLKYGYARGTAPVRYIDRIRDYADIIRRYDD